MTGLRGLLFLAVIFAAVSGRAALFGADDRLDRLFTVRGLEIDISARSSSEARREAIGEAERRGYQTLVAKLTQEEDRARLPDLNRSALQALISGLEIDDEQFSARRYRARFSIRFEPDVVSRFFADYGVPHVFAAGSGVMPFHVHAHGAEIHFWSDSPAMRDALTRVDWLNRLRQYEFPEGTLAERLRLSSQQVEDFDLAAGQRVATRYGNLDSLFIVTRWFGPTKGLKYEARLGRSDLAVGGWIRPSDENGALIEADAVASALDRVLSAIDRDWRSRLLVDVSQEGEVRFEIPSLDLDDWLLVLQRIEGLALVRDLQVRELGLPLGQVDVRYSGRRDQLMSALTEAGLRVFALPDVETERASSGVIRLELDGQSEARSSGKTG